jgi:hypothetical protein
MQETNSVKELFNKNGEVVNDTDSILDIEYDFYKDLYSSVQIENDKIDEFLEHVNKNIDEDDKIKILVYNF